MLHYIFCSVILLIISVHKLLLFHHFHAIPHVTQEAPMQTTSKPRLRHCTLIATENEEKLAMIVGKEHYELTADNGTRETFLKLKRYLDGRHTLSDISQRSGVALGNVKEIAAQFDALGLFRTAAPTAAISKDDFLQKVEQSTMMWRRQIGYHRLFGLLERGEAGNDLIAGFLLETYHFVRMAAQHIGTAIAHCDDPGAIDLLSEYLADEYRHHKLIADSVAAMGIPRDQIENAHPVIGTLSLVNMLCQIGRTSTLGYLCCLNLIEARPQDEQGSRAAWELIAQKAGLDGKVFDGLVRHMQIDVKVGHADLLATALSKRESIPAHDAHQAINQMHDLKHAFDQFHDQIVQYYTDVSNYVPRLTVDYFSL
jgi:hypothetical protein